VIAALRVGDEIIRGALAGPFHRAVERSRREQHERMLGIEEYLHPEAATHIGGHNAESVLGKLEDVLGELLLQEVRSLRGRLQREALTVPFAKGRARLQRINNDAVVDDPLFHDPCRLFECGVGLSTIAFLPAEANIARRLRPDLRHVRGDRRGRIDDHRQVFVVYVNELGGIPRRINRLCDHHGHRFAHVVHQSFGQRRARRGDERFTVHLLERYQARDGAEARRLHILAGVDSEHSGGSARCSGVDRAYACVRVR
jgi:hypothetical protein